MGVENIGSIGTGIDIVETARLERLIARQGTRFLRRCFTEAEIAECERKPLPALHYAGKFAAKEALYKALGLVWNGAFAWNCISVESRGGKPKVRLSGALHRYETAYRVELSITHAGAYAAAVALAIRV